MKIVKGVGEWLLPRWLRSELRPVLAFTGAGSALWTGSVVLATRGWAWIGERTDWQERLAGIVFAGYAISYSCVQAPEIARFAVPGALLGWCVAAWWHAPSVVDEPVPSVEARPTQDGFVRWLVALIGDAPGIHLRDLYPAMRTLPGHEGRDNAQLRAALRTLGVPIRRSLRLGGVAGRSGVARADLKPLLSPLGESSGDFDGDAGQATDSPAGELLGEGVETV